MNARRWALLAVCTIAWLICAFALDRAGAPEWWRYPLMLGYWLIYVVLGIATLGLGFLFSFITRLVVTAIVLLIADKLSKRLTIRGFMPALFASIIVAVTGSAVDFVLH